MQQYFTDTPLTVGEEYELTKEQAHHAVNVLHMHEETVRLVYQGKGYYATVHSQGKKCFAHVEKEDERINEMHCRVTLAVALIRREKFEWILQKAAELGVDRIIPFESSRCVVHARKEKADRQRERWQSIVLSAAQQCKRNIVPEVTDIMDFEELKDIDAQLKVCAYEKAGCTSAWLSQLYAGQDSAVLLIGPEGGFSESEIEQVVSWNYTPCTLGSRILRAETACVYGLSVLAEMDERRNGYEIFHL
ncbi:MAG: RsmE family RNA methyltransferase [Bulleidia sp.]